MAIKPIQPATEEEIKASEDKVKEEKEKIQKSVEEAGLDRPRDRHNKIDR